MTDKSSPNCAEIALHGKNCALSGKHQNCEKAVLHKITIFWGAGVSGRSNCPLQWKTDHLCDNIDLIITRAFMQRGSEAKLVLIWIPTLDTDDFLV